MLLELCFKVSQVGHVTSLPSGAARNSDVRWPPRDAVRALLGAVTDFGQTVLGHPYLIDFGLPTLGKPT